MSSSRSPSASAASGVEPGAYARLFAAASRRAQIVALVNSAQTGDEVAQATVDQLCEALEAELAFVAVTRRHHTELEVIGAVGLTAAATVALAHDPLCRAALRAARAEARAGTDLLGLGLRHVLLSPWRGPARMQAVIGVGRLYDEPFDRTEIALVEAVTPSVGHALERAWLSAERDRHTARQAALARTAKVLSASLVPEEVLQKLSSEVSAALEADEVVVCRAQDGGELQVVAGTAAAGGALDAPQESLCRRVARAGRPLIGEPSIGAPAAGRTHPPRRGPALAAPIRAHGRVEGVVLVAYCSEHRIEPEDVELMTAFTEFAGIAWRNAADHAAARRAAELDSLTGCLNHGAFQDRLREEIARADRTGEGFALVLLDLDEFKAVNDTLGHLAGDALLRDVADGLRASVRQYDHVGRYGGDEFALLLPATGEDAARRLTDRVLAVTAAVDAPSGAAVSASAGVAYWRPGDRADALIERADRAMLDMKEDRRRRAGRADRDAARERAPAGERRERRRPRGLTGAASLGTRLSGLLDQRAIVETAIFELAASLGYEDCLIVRLGVGDRPVVLAAAGDDARELGEAGPPRQSHRGPAAAMLAGVARAARERRTVLAAGADASAATGAAAQNGGATLCVPVYVGGELWGAIAVHAGCGVTLDDDDARLVQSVSDYLGTALRTAQLYQQFEHHHVATAAALAAALERKDAGTTERALSIADLAVAVGTELGLDAERLRLLRYAAILHDIGKIAVPNAILEKPGPLTAHELAAVRRHPVVGEQILQAVPSLSDVREIVRHDHERWDGGGYPDGLRGEQIPLGARIVLVVDAYHAMRSDRPYRSRLRPADARAELRRHAGTQFDPAVVDALLDVLDRQDQVEPALA